MEKIKRVISIIDYALKGIPLKENILAEDFFQVVNGRYLSLEKFHNETLLLRKDNPIIELKILSMAVSGDCVHSHHLVVTVDSNDQRKRFEVFSRWDFSNGLVVSCIESLRQMGDDESIDIFFPE